MTSKLRVGGREIGTVAQQIGGRVVDLQLHVTLGLIYIIKK